MLYKSLLSRLLWPHESAQGQELLLYLPNFVLDEPNIVCTLDIALCDLHLLKMRFEFMLHHFPEVPPLQQLLKLLQLRLRRVRLFLTHAERETRQKEAKHVLM